MSVDRQSLSRHLCCDIWLGSRLDWLNIFSRAFEGTFREAQLSRDPTEPRPSGSRLLGIVKSFSGSILTNTEARLSGKSPLLASAPRVSVEVIRSVFRICVFAPLASIQRAFATPSAPSSSLPASYVARPDRAPAFLRAASFQAASWCG
jgi:hypothetical protein